MITVQEATKVISENLFRSKPNSVPLMESIGRILSEPIFADRDLPPYDRVTMDGIAISFQQWKSGRQSFEIEDVQVAGQPQKILRNENCCMEVMTGAMLPTGTDTVIRYEDLKIQDGHATVLIKDIAKGQNIHNQGQDAKKGAALLAPKRIISPAEIALMASVGIHHIDVFSMPSAAIIGSGDELVDLEKNPEPHQIRRSNTYAIQAAMKQLQWSGTQYHLPDRKDFLTDSLETILANHDVLILSGGVSKGKYDFIPQVLEEIGIKKLFHEVSQRPGKPFWFGVSEKGKTVFALPGNPISTFMCFYRYIKPWYLCSLGIEPGGIYAALAKDVSFEPLLTYFLQVQVINENGVLKAYPCAGGGSGDFANLKDVDGFLELPMEKSLFKAGEVYPFIPFR